MDRFSKLFHQLIRKRC